MVLEPRSSSEDRGFGRFGRPEIHDLRAAMLERFHQQTIWCGDALDAATALLAAIGLVG